MTNEEICEAIRGRTVSEWYDTGFTHPWKVVPRLLGKDPDGRRVLVMQVLDASISLHRSIAEAGDGLRHTVWGPRDISPGLVATRSAYQGPLIPIPTERRRGISLVLCET